MGGEGSIQHMINTLRNNKKLLRKKNFFKKDRTFLHLSFEDFKGTSAKPNLKNATEEELAVLRAKLIKERKKTFRINLIAIISILCFGAVMVFYFIHKNNINKTQLKAQEEEMSFIENYNQYVYYIQEGDKWMEKSHWHNSIYIYEQAVNLLPNEFDANYKLALAYAKSCKNENKNCEKAKKSHARLKEQFPNKTPFEVIETLLK